MDSKNTKRISIQNISKNFKIGYKNDNGLLLSFLSLFSGKEPQKTIQVLDDVSFDAYAGENIGIIGKNGSGKSTLLRIIANIYRPDSGTINTDGKLVYIDGYGLGLKKKLTMRENIYLAGLLIGLSSKEIDNRFSEIVSFSELEEFVDTKIYQFSSGMLSRLSFSTTIHFLEHKNSEIILLDEVFGSGGDLSFQNKATERMKKFIEGGSTVVLVSHDLNLIEKYCNRVILLHKGKKIEEGVPELVIENYRKLHKN